MDRKRIRWATAGVTCLAAVALLAITVPTGVGAKPAANIARQVTADDQGHLHIVGGVTSNAGKCFKYVTVRIQMYDTGAGAWTKIGKGKTDGTGYYDVSVADNEGRYRSVVPRTTKGPDVCVRDVSQVVRHNHP